MLMVGKIRIQHVVSMKFCPVLFDTRRTFGALEELLLCFFCMFIRKICTSVTTDNFKEAYYFLGSKESSKNFIFFRI